MVSALRATDVIRGLIGLGATSVMSGITTSVSV